MLGSYVYIITNKRNGTLYTGVTSDLKKRIWEHKEGVIDGFSKKYGLKSLVWFEVHDDIEEAIRREKQIKKWERKWKLRMIEEQNFAWLDLYEGL
jgi:putative endonuclease